MAGRIPQTFIDEVLARTDLVGLIGEHVRLKKAGRGQMGLCPFHKEKSPSFNVDPERQFYYCFGCHASGTALSFLMDYLRLDFLEAIEELASRVGLSVPREAGPGDGRSITTQQYTPLYARTQDAMTFYMRQLREHPEAARAVDYLKRRGVSGRIARDFALGFAPPGWDQLCQALGKEPEALRDCINVGLIIEKDGGRHYDRFRDRVMFPIRDQRGRVLGFGGRVLDQGEPKYLNSPESPIFHKGRELYGLFEARQAGPAKAWLVVEGYMDVIALAQHGLHHVVATLGTATTPEHLERLFRQAGEIVFCFDGDKAGRRAAWRALEVALPLLGEQHYASFLFLPEGEDPDTLVRREGVACFEDSERRTSLSSFLFDHLSEGLNLAQVDEHRARLVDLARPLLQQIGGATYRRVLFERLSSLVRLDLPEARRQTEELDSPPGFVSPPLRGRGREPPSLCKRLLHDLLLAPDLARHVEGAGEFAHLQDRWAPLLSEVVGLLQEGEVNSAVALLPRFEDTRKRQALAELLQAEGLVTPEGRELEFLARLRKVRELAQKMTPEEREAELRMKLRPGNHKN